MTSKPPIKLGIPGDNGQVSFLFTKGGARQGAGRKAIGETRKVSITLPSDTWSKLEQLCETHNTSKSEMLRNMIVNVLSNSLPPSSENR